MSWEHVELVRRQHQPSTAKLLLYVIALRSNAEGACWPSVNTLAQDSGLARRTVQAQLAYLEGQDLLRRKATPGRANGLRLNVRKLRAGAGLAEVHDDAATGAPNASQPSTPCVPPAKNLHPAARQVHSSCAPAAPEVKREELFNKKDNTGGGNANTANPLPERGRSVDSRWWLSETGIRLKGMELGISARPGESYDDYKSRLLRAKRDPLSGCNES